MRWPRPRPHVCHVHVRSMIIRVRHMRTARCAFASSAAPRDGSVGPGSAAPYIAPLWALELLCPCRLVAGGWAWRRDPARRRFADVSCGERSVRAVAQLPPRALRAPLVGAASADHTHRQSGRQRASACCICASTTAPGPSRYLAATHRQRRHLHSHSAWVRPHAQRRCVGELVRAHCGWVEGRERQARESSVDGLECSKK